MHCLLFKDKTFAGSTFCSVVPKIVYLMSHPQDILWNITLLFLSLPSNFTDILFDKMVLSVWALHDGKGYYSETSEKGTLWDQYKFKWFVPFIEVVLF